MHNFIDQMAWGIFGQRDYEIAYTTPGRMFLIFETQEKAEEFLGAIKHPANSWRVAPIRIMNGGFVPND